MERLFERLAQYGIEVTRVEEDETREVNEKATTESMVDDDNTTTEQFVEEIIKTLAPKTSKDEPREAFEILMPTGELKKVELWSGATLLDLGRRLDDRFGENSLIIGLKKDGGTVLPRNYPKIKIYNTKAARERISIVFV